MRNKLKQKAGRSFLLSAASNTMPAACRYPPGLAAMAAPLVSLLVFAVSGLIRRCQAVTEESGITMHPPHPRTLHSAADFTTLSPLAGHSFSRRSPASSAVLLLPRQRKSRPSVPNEPLQAALPPSLSLFPKKKRKKHTH